MKVKALTSFAGPETMFGGEIKDIADKQVLDDLIKCGYVEAVEDAKVSSTPAKNSDNKASQKLDKSNK